MQRRGGRNRRAGLALVIALVALTVIMVLIVGWAQLALVQAREAQVALDRLQAGWLAESAINRAAARLQSEPDYGGETWQIASTEFGRPAVDGDAPLGVVEIAVEPLAGRPEALQISVRADFPAGGRRPRA